MKIIVNGCFDCFHEGHAYLIKKARFIAKNTVIVLINSDNSVKQLKGKNRPIDNLDKRLNNIWECWRSIPVFDGCHIEVYAFDSEKELKQLIDKHQPDMIIKGNDRPDVRKIVGSDKYPVCILPRLKDSNGKDISTTRIINEQKEKTNA